MPGSSFSSWISIVAATELDVALSLMRWPLRPFQSKEFFNAIPINVLISLWDAPLKSSIRETAAVK